MKENPFKTISHFSLSDSLRAEWNQLWQTSDTANIENSPEWFEAACEAFHHEQRLILAAYDATNDNLIAVIPLVKVRLYGFSVYTTPGLNFITHAAILGDLSEPVLKKELVATLEKLGTIYFSGLTKKEADEFSRNQSISLFQSDVEYLMDFTKGPFGEFSERRARAILNRAKRSPEQISVCVVKKDYTAALQICFDIDQMSDKHRNGKGVFWRDDARMFYTLLAQKCPSHLSIILLYFGDKPITYYIQFLYNKTYVGSQKAYLPEYTYYNPGFLVFMKFIEAVLPEDPLEISFGKGLGRFKTDFAGGNIRILYSAIVSKNNFNRVLLTRILQMRERIYCIVVAYPRLYAKFKFLKDGLWNYRDYDKSLP